LGGASPPHRSVRPRNLQLEADIRAFIKQHNENPTPYRWTKFADPVVSDPSKNIGVDGFETVFGHLRNHASRFEVCVCGRSAASSPRAAFFLHHSTPELRYLRVKLGCTFSYQQAADILNESLPNISCFNHATTRNRVLAEGKEIEAATRAEIAEKPSVEGPVEHMIVSVDGAFVKATRSKN
jgi:hypothetical protein